MKRTTEKTRANTLRMTLLATAMTGCMAVLSAIPSKPAMAVESGTSAQADGTVTYKYGVLLNEQGVAEKQDIYYTYGNTGSRYNGTSAQTVYSSNANTYGNVAIGNYSVAGSGTDTVSSSNYYTVYIRADDYTVGDDGYVYYPNSSGNLTRLYYPYYVIDSEGNMVWVKRASTQYTYLTEDTDGRLWGGVMTSTDEDGNTTYYGYLLQADGTFATTKSELTPNYTVDRTYPVTNATAVGNAAKASATNTVAVGNESTAAHYEGIAIGDNAQAGNPAEDAKSWQQGTAAVAVGANTKAWGDGSIAVGVNAQSYGYGSVAAGANAGANTNGSIAIGQGATVKYINGADDHIEQRVAENAIAIGYNSTSAAKDASAIGYQSQALLRNATAYGVNSHANGWNTVAIGNKSIAGSQDTVNGTDLTEGQSAVAVGNRATALSEYSTAIGASTYAEGTHAVAVGDSNRATGAFSTAIGAGWSTYTVDEDDNENTEKARSYESIGANQASGDYSTAVGYNNATTGQASTALGAQNDVSGTGSIAIGYGNVIGTPARADTSSLVASTYAARSSSVTGYAFGSNNTVTGSNGIAMGTGAAVTADNSVAIGTGASATVANSVAIGAGSTTEAVVPTTVVTIPGAGQSYSNISGTNPVGTVSVGTAGAERTITNVAAGRIGPGSTDAINGSELYAVRQEAKADTTKIANDMRTMERNFRGGVALTLATAGLPQAYLPGKSMLAAGVGTYQGEQGLAVGFSSISDNGSWVFKLTGSTSTRGDGGASAGAGYQF